MTHDEIVLGLREVSNTPIDRASIHQDFLDLANRTRTSRFAWRGQFSPELIELLLKHFIYKDMVVLDPFAGSGTVLFECAQQGIQAYGVEINPAAAELAKTVHLANHPIQERQKYLSRSWDLLLTHLGAFIEPLFGSSRSLPCEEDCLKQLISEAKRDPLVFTLVMGTLVRASIMRGPHINWRQVPPAFDKQRQIVEQLPVTEKPCRVLTCDARSIPLDDGLIDAVITSPPYINVFNYHQNYRRLFEYAGWDLLEVSRSEIGSNRFNRGNRFLTVIEYSIDMLLSLIELRRLVKQGGRIIVIVGRESRVRGVRFEVWKIIETIAVSLIGWKLERRQERKYTNRFGQLIFEDILHFTCQSPTLNQEPGLLVHQARILGQVLLGEVLDKAQSAEVIQGIEDAIRRAPFVEPAKMFRTPALLEVL